MPINRWFTPAEDGVVRQMAQAGEYAAACAKRLGRTRNSIIGRAHRLGVTFRNGNHGNKNHAPRPAAFDRTGVRTAREKIKNKQLVVRPAKRVTWGRFWGPRYY